MSDDSLAAKRRNQGNGVRQQAHFQDSHPEMRPELRPLPFSHLGMDFQDSLAARGTCEDGFSELAIPSLVRSSLSCGSIRIGNATANNLTRSSNYGNKYDEISAR